MTNKDVLRRKFNIPYVEVDNVNDEILGEIIEYMDEIYTKYPALINTLVSFCSCDDMTKHLYMAYYADPDMPEDVNITWKEIKNDFIFSIIIIGGYEKNCFMGFSYNNKLKKYTYNESISYIYGPSYIDCYNLEFAIYHEFGHILCNTMRLNIDLDFRMNIYFLSNKYKTIWKDISTYAGYQNNKDQLFEEAIADAFAIYSLHPEKANELINYIGSYINKKYKELEKSPLFNINYSYQKMKRK